MRVNDTCSCGATFSARGLPGNVAQLYAAWLNAHRRCRGDNRVIEVETT